MNFQNVGFVLIMILSRVVNVFVKTNHPSNQINILYYQDKVKDIVSAYVEKFKEIENND